MCWYIGVVGVIDEDKWAGHVDNAGWCSEGGVTSLCRY